MCGVSWAGAEVSLHATALADPSEVARERTRRPDCCGSVPSAHVCFQPDEVASPESFAKGKPCRTIAVCRVPSAFSAGAELSTLADSDRLRDQGRRSAAGCGDAPAAGRRAADPASAL